MFIKKVKTPGLAHLSYVCGVEGKAVVIDPRRDCQIYIDIANKEGCRITHILETHRNEDLITGSVGLSKLTGATIYHGPNADGNVEYANTVNEGDDFSLGSLRIEVLETPGHTKDSVSYLVFDEEFNNGPAAIFTGDTLFVGDVGRTDFYPDEADHVAGMLYDSLQKIKKTAKNAIIYPAHGAGSVCGDGMADREFSTVMHEFDNSPALQLDSKDKFIKKKVEEFHYQPPYFKLMEKLNLVGAETTCLPSTLKAISPSEFMKRDNAILIDIRNVESYLGAHYPDSVCLPLSMITAYAGWLFSSDDEFVIIADDAKSANDAARHFARIGYDNIEYYNVANFPAFAAQGGRYESLAIMSAEKVKNLVESDEATLLDVRKKNEVGEEKITNSKHVFLGKLIEDIETLDKSTSYITMCASGMRATVAASVLKRYGFDTVKVFMGSMGAWKKAGYETVKSD